jgi:hypothetical protein
MIPLGCEQVEMLCGVLYSKDEARIFSNFLVTTNEGCK